MFNLLADNEKIASALRDYIEEKLHPYCMPPYSYLVINKKYTECIQIISNYPIKWQQLYLENKWHHIDPVILTAYKRTSPFFWDEDLTNRTSDLFLLAREYNVINGVTFVLHDQLNNMALLSLLFDRGSGKSNEDMLIDNKAQLQLLLIDIHEKMHKLTAACSHAEDDDFTKKSIFSRRETEVIYWASMGKTYGEISLILAISERTVKFHMANVVRKMGVSNARQAIRLGMERELITLPPTI